MATYREIQDYIRAHSRFVAKTCWISHVLSDHGLTNGVSGNRIDLDNRAHPCPPNKRQKVEDALRHFGMIGRS